MLLDITLTNRPPSPQSHPVCLLQRLEIIGVLPVPPTVRFPTLITGFPQSLIAPQPLS